MREFSFNYLETIISSGLCLFVFPLHGRLDPSDFWIESNLTINIDHFTIN